MSFTYTNWMPHTWEFGGATHQLDPLSLVMHDNELTPLHQVIGMDYESAVSISFEWRISQIRKERDRRLADTDWWVLPDRNPTPEQLAYRQALRDITVGFSPTVDVVWPTKPE